MFGKLFDTFLANPRDSFGSEDGPLVFAALLIRVARADGVFDAQEREVITQSLGTHYAMNADDVTALMARAAELEATAPDTVRFTRAIKETVPLEDRGAIMRTIWKTILADGTRDAEEDALARLVASLLGLDDVTSAQLRQQAQRDLG